jgi:hypothetical protein
MQQSGELPATRVYHYCGHGQGPEVPFHATTHVKPANQLLPMDSYHVASIDRGYMKKMWKEGLASVVLSVLTAVFFGSIGMLLRWPSYFFPVDS